MIDLSNATPFGEGGRRICFQHPHNPDLCIKISKQDVLRQRRANAPLYRRLRPLTSFDDNHDEARGYRQLVVRRALGDDKASLWHHIPKCYGFCETTMGEGLVLDYYHSHGTPAPSIERLLGEQGLTPQLRMVLNEFAEFLQKSLLVTADIIPHNMVLAADGRVKFIDGIGSRNLIPLAEFFPYARYNIFARRKVEKHVKNMWHRVDVCLEQAGR